MLDNGLRRNNDLKILRCKVLKPIHMVAETGAWERGWVVILSERPNVRVHNDPAIRCLSREAAGHNVTGRPFLGVPILWAGKERVQNNHFKKLVCSFLCSLQRNEPKKRCPAACPPGADALTKTINTVVITNSYPPAGLKHVITYFRVYELRSAALLRVLKSKT